MIKKYFYIHYEVLFYPKYRIFNFLNTFADIF